MARVAFAYLLGLLVLIASFAALLAMSLQAYAALVFVALYLLTALAPAVFGYELAGGLKRPWLRVLATLAATFVTVAAFVLMGTTLLWPSLLLALPLSLFLEWRTSRRHPAASHDV